MVSNEYKHFLLTNVRLAAEMGQQTAAEEVLRPIIKVKVAIAQLKSTLIRSRSFVLRRNNLMLAKCSKML